MKILTGKQIREADMQTMLREPVASIDLMERASAALAAEVSSMLAASGGIFRCGTSRRVVVFAGKGNNGGDGLAVARMLSEKFCVSSVCLCRPEEMTSECRENLERLPENVEKFLFEELPSDFVETCRRDNAVVIDAILGTGVRGEVRGAAGDAIRYVNALGCPVISLDMPSGLPTEPDGPACGAAHGKGEPAVVKADVTLTLEFPKLSLMLPSTGAFAGRLKVLGIGLDKNFIASCPSCMYFIEQEDVEKMFSRRPDFAHKGNFGHVLMIAGSRGMAGAAVLSVGGALRSGCGLVTAHIPECAVPVIQAVHPCAIVDADPAGCFSILPPALGRYAAVGAGCGLRQSPETIKAVGDLLGCGIPLVLDADALNIIASKPDYLRKVPAGSILTPHVGEFVRLVAAAVGSGFISEEDLQEWALPGCGLVSADMSDDMARVAAARCFAAKTASVVVLKGAHTMTCTPDGRIIFNMTGNPGMAKGGSGDVLAGLVAGLRARGLSAEQAAVAGVWHHGLAGDRAAAVKGEESMNASDILDNIRI